MIWLERRLKESCPPPVAAAEHRRALRESLRERTAAEARMEALGEAVPWPLARYAAAMAASLALVACVGAGTLLAGRPAEAHRAAHDPVMGALVKQLERTPGQARLGAGASRGPMAEAVKEELSRETIERRVVSYLEQQQVLEELLRTGI